MILRFLIALLLFAPFSAKAQDADVDEIVARNSRALLTEIEQDYEAIGKPAAAIALTGDFDGAEAQALASMKASPRYEGEKFDDYKQGFVREALKRELLNAAHARDWPRLDQVSAVLLRYYERIEKEKASAAVTPDALALYLLGEWLEARSKAYQAASAEDKDHAGFEKMLATLLAVHERKMGSEAPDLAEGYASLGALARKQGHFKDAAPYLARAVALQVKAKGEHDALALSFMAEQARNESDLDRHPEAEALNRRIHAARVALHGPESREALAALNNIALNIDAQGRKAEAEAMHRDLLARRRTAFGDRDDGTRLSANHIAYFLLDQGKLDEAEAMIAFAMPSASERNAEAEERRAELSGLLADLRMAQGRKDEAVALRRRKLDYYDKEYGPDAPQTINEVGNLAVVLSEVDRDAEAEPLARRVLEHRTARLGEDHALVALAWSNLASVLSGTGKVEEAEAAYKKSIDLYTKLYGPDHPELAIVYRNFGIFLNDQNRAGGGIEWTRKGLALDEATLPPFHPSLATGRTNLASSLIAQGETAEAIALLRKVIAGLEPRVPASNKQLLLARMFLSGALEADETARMESFTLARAAVAGVREAYLATRDAQSGSKAFSSTSPFERLLKSAWALRETPAAPDAEMAAFEAAQDLTIGPSSAAMAQAAARAAAQDGKLAALVREKQDWEAQRQKAESELTQAFSIARTTRPDTQIKQLADAESRLKAIDRRIDKDFPAYRTMVSPAPATLADIRARLAPDEGLLLIVPTGTEVYSFAVSHKASRWHRNEDEETLLRSSISSLRCQVDPITCSPKDREQLDLLADSPKGREQYQPYNTTTAYFLYSELIAPVEGALEGVKRLYVVSTGAFGDLPLAMLATERPDFDADLADPEVLLKTPWLADRYAITRLTSVSALRLPPPALRAVENVDFRGYGAPELQGSERALSRGASAFKAEGEGPARRYMADVNAIRTLQPLPGTRVELNAMAASLGAAQGSLHLGTEASEKAFRADPSVSKARILAFATHGLLPGEASSVNEPGLVMTPPETADWQDDGVLAASEIASLSLSAEWVILSACNTASAQGDQGGDSLSGLARGFLYAGARSLLATHWRVSDEATAALTVETLAARKRDPKLTRAQALQVAMRTVRSGKRPDGSALEGWSEEWAHPSAWAPFSAIANRDE